MSAVMSYAEFAASPEGTDQDSQYSWRFWGSVAAGYQRYLRDMAIYNEWERALINAQADGYDWATDPATGEYYTGTLDGLLYNPLTKLWAILPPHGGGASKWGTPNAGGYIELGDGITGGRLGDRAATIRNAAYTGGGDMITGFLDAGGGVAIFMAAVGALAISGAGIGLANTVTEAVAAGTGTVTTTGMIAETTVAAGEVAAGEVAAQTVAVAQASSMTAAQVAAEINALTMTTALDAAAVNAAAQAGIITAAEQATLLQTVATGAIDLASTAGRNVLQKAIEENLKPPTSTPTTPAPTTPPPVNAPMTAAEQAAKLIKDQAVKLATGAGGSAFIKALTGGAGQPQPNRNLPAYLQNQPQLTNTGESGSVLPIALIVAALTLLG